MVTMRYNRCKNVILWLFLLPAFSLFAQQEKEVADCENYIVGGRYTTQLLEIRLKIMKKDFLIYSVYGYFEKSLEVLDKQLAMYGVTMEQRKKIISEIKERTHWNKEQIASIYETEFKNPEYLRIYNHFDITKSGKVNLGTIRFPINDIIEKYLEEKHAKEIIENLLRDYANSSSAYGDIENIFCIYQKLKIPIEGYGTIPKDFKYYIFFIKDYLGYTISHEK